MKYQILHIPTNRFIKTKYMDSIGLNRSVVLQFKWHWTAKRWYKKLPDEFYIILSNTHEKVLKAELVIVPVNTNMDI